MTTRHLADLRAPEVADALGPASVLIQPVGAIEQHGPHLPLSTDLLIASELAAAVVAERGDELDRHAGCGPAAGDIEHMRGQVAGVCHGAIEPLDHAALTGPAPA